MMLLAAFQLTQPNDALKRAKESEGGEEGVVGVEEGRGVQGGLEHCLLLEQEELAERWWPPQQGKPGDLLPAVDDEPLQQHPGDGGDAQELVARSL